MTVVELKTEILRLWDVYSTSTDPVVVDATYDVWSRLVAELYVLTRDRKTRRVLRVD